MRRRRQRHRQSAAEMQLALMCERPVAVPCNHEFAGWRTFDDGMGGETICRKCGIGAMAWSMRFLP